MADVDVDHAPNYIRACVANAGELGDSPGFNGPTQHWAHALTIYKLLRKQPVTSASVSNAGEWREGT